MLIIEVFLQYIYTISVYIYNISIYIQYQYMYTISVYIYIYTYIYMQFSFNQHGNLLIRIYKFLPFAGKLNALLKEFAARPILHQLEEEYGISC